MDIDIAIDRFLEYCDTTKGRSLKTIKMYRYYLNFFKKWFIENISKNNTNFSVELIDSDSIRKFRIYISQEYINKYKGSLKRQTQNYFLVALRSFFRFLIRQELKVISPEMIELGRKELSDRQFLSKQDLDRLFNAVDLKEKGGLRDRTILEVLFSTGLRVSELVSLNLDQINLELGEFGVIGKGRKRRIVYLSDKAKEWLIKYLKTRNDPYQPLFIRYSGPKNKNDLTTESYRLSVRSVERMIDKHRKKAGLFFRFGPHALRHSFATDLLGQGADLRSIQELLGHKNISTTQIYTHYTNPQLREVHRKFHSGNK